MRTLLANAGVSNQVHVMLLRYCKGLRASVPAPLCGPGPEDTREGPASDGTHRHGDKRQGAQTPALILMLEPCGTLPRIVMVTRLTTGGVHWGDHRGEGCIEALASPA